MKFFYFLSISVIFSNFVCAQECAWADTANFCYHTWATAAKSDSAGNVYVIGKYENDYYATVAYEPRGSFVRKYGKNGNTLWTKFYNKAYNEDLLITADKIIILGRFWGTGASFNGITPQTVQGGFILSLDGNGVIQKFKEYANAIFLKGEQNSEGDLFVAGGFFTNWGGNGYVSDTLDMDGILLVNPANLDHRELVSARFDKNFNCIWAIQSSGAVLNTQWGFDMDINGSGFYICGTYLGTFQVNNSFSITSVGTENGFILKLDLKGNIKWLKNISGNNGVQTHGACEKAMAITSDSKMNLYATFSISDSIMFENLNLNPGVYLIKYDSLGNFQWVKKGIGNSVKCFNDTLLILGGAAAGTVYGNLTVAANGSYLIKADTSGNPFWIWQAPGGAANMGFYANPDNDGNIYLAGTFSGSIDFGNGISFAGYKKMFVTKLVCSHATEITKTYGEKKSINIFPNPANGIFQISYSSHEKNKLTLNITNARGQVVYTETISKFDGMLKKEIDLSSHATGIYFIEVITNRGKEVRKIILE